MQQVEDRPANGIIKPQARDGEALYRALAANLPGGAAFVVDHNLRYLLAEGQALTAAGLTPADFEGKTIFEALEPELAHSYETYYRQALAGRPFEVEHTRHGQRYVTHGTPLRDAQGEVYAALAVSYDITERARVEEALRVSEARQSTILETMAEGVVTLDLENHFTSVNAAAERILGVHRTDLLGRSAGAPPFRRLTLDGKPLQNPPSLAEVTASGDRTFHDDYIIERRDGSQVTISRNIAAFRDRDGVCMGFVATITDITERKQAEEALRQSEERLRLATMAGQIGTCDWNYPVGEMRWNDVRFRMHGLEPQDRPMRNDEFYALVHPDDRERVRREIETGVEVRGEHAEEYRAVWPDGRVRWLVETGRVVSWQNDRPLRVISVVFDVTERKRAEEALREGETRLQLALASGRMGAWDWDLTTGREVWTPEQERLFGRAPGAPVGESYDVNAFFNQVHPDDLPGIRARAERADAEGLDFVEDEFRIRLPDGTERWLFSRARFHRDAQGKAVRMTGVNMDVTQNKRAEQTVRESEERLRLATEAAHLYSWEFDARTQRYKFSPNAAAILGLDPADLPRTVEDTYRVVHPDDCALIQEALERAFRTGQGFAMDFRSLKRNGEPVWLSVQSTMQRDEAGHPVRLLGIAQDITPRKQAEEALRQSEERFRRVVESRPVGVLFADIEGRITQVNDALADMLGATREWLVGKRWVELTPPEFAARDVEASAELFATGSIQPYEKEYFRADGSLLPVIVAATVLRVGDGFEAVALVIDNTERKRAEAALRHLNEELEQRVAERTAELRESQEQLRRLSLHVEKAREDERARIAREVHDELGGSLTGLKFSVVRAINGLVSPADLPDVRDDIKQQIDGLVKTVRRIASELRPPLLDDLGLTAAMEWQAGEWEKHTGIACLLRLPPYDIALDHERRTALFRVFQESLTNVARHATGATTVTVFVRQEGEAVTLMVHDDGCGILPEALRPGRSLGLMGMRERIREVHGDLEIFGGPGQGTTVRAQVPVDVGRS